MSSFASITITGVLTVCNVMMVNMMKLMNKIAITIIVKSIKIAGESMMKVEVLEASPQTFVSPISQSSCSLWSLYLKKKKLYYPNDINIYWIITYYGHYGKLPNKIYSDISVNCDNFTITVMVSSSSWYLEVLKRQCCLLRSSPSCHSLKCHLSV